MLIGRDSGGRKIPGGPYTVTQLATLLMVAPFTWMLTTKAGMMGGSALVWTLGITALAVWLAGRASMAGHNPAYRLAGVLTGTVGALTRPYGRQGNRIVTRAKPRSITRGPIGLVVLPGGEEAEEGPAEDANEQTAPQGEPWKGQPAVMVELKNQPGQQLNPLDILPGSQWRHVDNPRAAQNPPRSPAPEHQQPVPTALEAFMASADKGE